VGVAGPFCRRIDARMEIIGTEGALYVDIHNQGLRVHTGRLTYPDTTYGPQLHGRPVGIMTDEIAEFIRAVVDGLPSPVSAADGYRAVVAADAIERSVRTGLPSPCRPSESSVPMSEGRGR
jgi:predicted dehydrogenase